MTSTDNLPAGDAALGSSAQKYRRRMRNYLLDVGLQLRYTMTIVIVAVFLTAGLGYKMYQATRDISKVIELSGMADPSVADELQGQFAASDRWVLWGIVGFGVVLVISIGAVGILITHKVAGPLFKISSFFARIRDNRIGPLPASLRKGDELQEFYASFLDMHQALRLRTEEEARTLGEIVSSLETGGAAGAQKALEELRQADPQLLSRPATPRATGRSAPPSFAREDRVKGERCEAMIERSAAYARRMRAALTRHRPCRNSPGKKQHAYPINVVAIQATPVPARPE
jgi:hypothetical protein